MVWDQMMGKWSLVKGKAKETWGRFTENDLEVIQGKRDQLLGKIRKVYGVAKDEAERQVQRFEKSAGAAFKSAARAAGLGKEARKSSGKRAAGNGRKATARKATAGKAKGKGASKK